MYRKIRNGFVIIMNRPRRKEHVVEVVDMHESKWWHCFVIIRSKLFS